MTTIQKNKIRKIILPIIIVLITLILMKLIFANPPQNSRFQPSKAPQMTVATMSLEAKPYQVNIESFGTVEPRTQSVLYSQVSGQIMHVNEQVRTGGFFNKGDTLIQLDARDYQAEVKISQANLIAAKQNLAEEQARVSQAKADWQRLGNGKKASELVLRKPQLAAAQGQILAAEAQLEKAQLALNRTTIKAPYNGRILKKHVDIGQVVSSNTALADIYAVDYVEIRLPIKNKDLPLMELPEEFIDTNSSSSPSESRVSNVTLTSDLMGHQQWLGTIVRTESAIDESTQQLYVVAQIISPYASNSQSDGQIKIGQYVTAQLAGKKLADALVIPSSAIYQGSYVYTVEEGVLKRKNIQVKWQNGQESIISDGLVAGDELVLTSLGQVNSGTPVAIDGQRSVANDNSQMNKVTN